MAKYFSGSAPGITSLLQKTYFSEVLAAKPGFSRMPESSAGTTISVVTEPLLISSTSRSGSLWSPGGTMTTVPPESTGQNTSRTRLVMLRVVRSSWRSPGSSGKVRWSQRCPLSRARCVSITPLGVPVDPEV